MSIFLIFIFIKLSGLTRGLSVVAVGVHRVDAAAVLRGHAAEAPHHAAPGGRPDLSDRCSPLHLNPFPSLRVERKGCAGPGKFRRNCRNFFHGNTLFDSGNAFTYFFSFQHTFLTLGINFKQTREIFKFNCHAHETGLIPVCFQLPNAVVI